MGALDDFFQGKVSKTEGTGSSGSALSDFFDKKVKEGSAQSSQTGITQITSINNAPPERAPIDDLIEKAQTGGHEYVQSLDQKTKDFLTDGLKYQAKFKNPLSDFIGIQKQPAVKTTSTIGIDIASIPEADKKLIEEFDRTPKEDRTALKISSTPEEIDRIGKYRDWSVKYTPEDQKKVQETTDIKTVQAGQALGATEIQQVQAHGSLDALKSLKNIGTPGQVDIQGILDIGLHPITTGAQVLWDYNEHLKPAKDEFMQAFGLTDEPGLTTTDRVLKGGRAIVDAIFSPITYAISKTGDENNPESTENMLGKVLGVPFEIMYETFKAGGKIVGLSDSASEDLGIIMAGILPFIKGAKEIKGTDLSTMVDKSKEQFTKITDLQQGIKEQYKKGAMEVHPDISGLDSSYMARFNEAAAKGDTKIMDSIVQEVRKAKSEQKGTVIETPDTKIMDSIVQKKTETKAPIEQYKKGDTIKYETVTGDIKEGVLEEYTSKVDGSKKLAIQDNGVNYFTPNFRGKIETPGKIVSVSAGIVETKKQDIAVDSGKSPQAGKIDYDLMKAGEYNPELKKLRTIANNYKEQYDRIDSKIMEMKSQGREVPEDMMNDKIDIQEKLRASNWKAEDLFDEIKVQEEKNKTTPEVQEKIDDISKMNTEDTIQKYTPEEITQIQHEEEKQMKQQIENDHKEYKMQEKISEDSDITYGDLEVLAQRITNVLRDPKARFGLKRAKNADVSTKIEKYLKTSTEATIEALTEEFQSLKNGLKEIADYYAMNKKHPYTQQKLRELQNIISKGEYDFLEQSDIFSTTINPYLYEGKKQVPENVGKTTTRGTGKGSKGSNTNGGNDGKQKQEKEVGTSKTGIVNALEKVDEEFSKTESKYPQFAEIDKKTAMEASRGISFEPEKRGEQRIVGFQKEMEELYDEVMKAGKTDEQKAMIEKEVIDLSEKLAAKQNDINRASSGIVSSMITGPARFPVDRMQKRNEALRKKEDEYMEFKDRQKKAIIQKAENFGKAPDTRTPLQIVKDEIESFKNQLEIANKVNKTIRKYNTPDSAYNELIKLGIREDIAKEVSTPDRSGKLQSIYTVNIRAKIKDREAKAAKLEKMESVKGTDAETKVLYTFAGGKVIDNVGADRVQIIFDERPNSDTIYDLKKKGWKWSPKNEAWQRFRNSGSVRVARDMFPEVETKKFQSTKLTTKILNKLGDRETVSKEFIMNLTNSGDIKQVEKDIIRALLDTEGEKINVAEFKVKVESELLPLERKRLSPIETKYEGISLPPETRGSVKSYHENIYESPINTKAGDVHFSYKTEKYFGHTRVEDMAGTDPYSPDYTKSNGVRRVIEIQSDLYQRGRMDEEKGYPETAIYKDKQYKVSYVSGGYVLLADMADMGKPASQVKAIMEAPINDVSFGYKREREIELQKLKQYNDPTAHFRMIREELAQASQDNIEKVQFPTGETAMNIEGLGVNNDWFRDGLNLKTDRLEVAAEISQTRDGSRYGSEDLWIITEVLGDGKFKAIPKNEMSRLEYDSLKEGEVVNDVTNSKYVEEFDISDTIDKNNPIYKFYEKEVSRYVKNNYNAKLITDDKGVSWYEVEVTDDMKNQVLAFQNQGDQSNAWIYDIIGEKYGVKPFAQEKVDIHEAYMEAIDLAPEGWKVRVEDPTPDNFLENVVAYADLAKKEIVISTNEARKSTASHEVVHAALSELPEAQRKVIIETAKKQWEGETKKTLTDEQAEEFLAEEFKYFIENRKYKTKTLFGRLKEFLAKLWNTIKGLFGKGNKIKTFYEDIMAGKIVNAETRVGKKFQSKESERKIKEIDKKLDKTPNKYLESFVDFSSESFVPIDSVIGSIDESLRQRLIDMEYGIHNSEITQEGRKILRSLKDKIGKRKDSEEYKKMDIAMKNRDSEVVESMAKELGVEEDIKDIRTFLDKIHTAGESVGIDQGYFEEYFPRTTKDAKGLIRYFEKSEAGTKIQEAIKKIEIRESRELTDDEKIKVANDLLMGRTIEGVSLSKLGNTLKRKIEMVGSEINPFYNDSMDSLAIYIQGMNDMIEQRKLFGKVYSEKEIEGIRKVKSLKNSIQAINDELYPLFEEYDGYDREKAMEKRKEYRNSMKESSGEDTVKLQEKINKISKEIDNFDRMTVLRERKKIKIEEGKEYLQFEKDLAESEKQNDINSSIGAYTLELIKEGKITMEQERILTRALEARFSKPHMSAFISAYRSVTYITTMGSFFSAISQVQDLAFSIHENGKVLTVNNYGKALFGFSKIKVQDIGIEPIVFEFSDPGKLQQAVALTFKMAGITLMDKAGKETMINGYYQKMQRKLNNPGKYGNLFTDTWMKKFEFTLEQQSSIIGALKKNEVNEDIKLILFHKLTQYQPITPSQMPRNYLMSGNARILYTLKTYQLKQIDVIRREGLKKISDGKRSGNAKLAIEGWKSLASIAFWLFAMGCTSDILKDLLGNRPINISDLVWDNIAKILGFSKYTIYQGKEKGLGAVVLSMINPPFNLFNDPFIDFTYFQTHPFDPTKLQTINNIPIIGKPFYWWIGKGADKSDKKRTEGTKSVNMPVKKSTSGFSIKSGFSTKSGFSKDSGFK